MLLKERVAVVAGVGPGLGAATALALVREGAAVVLAARTGETLDRVAHELAGSGGTVATQVTDLTRSEQCEALVARATEAFGGLDVLVNNAAVPDPGEAFDTVDLDTWRAVAEVNLFGALRMTHAAVPALSRRGHGSVVFVSSMIVRQPMPHQGGYAASKGALLSAAEVLARELGPRGIRVNTVVPGWLRGPSVDRYLARQARRTGRSVDAGYAALAKRVPLGALATDADAANAVVYFASDLSAVVTGQALDVNGGEVSH